MAACVPAIRPLYLILLHRPGAENYGGSSRQKKSYQRQNSPHDKLRKKKGPDTEIMSLDTGWNATTLRGTDGDGEGLVGQGDGAITQTIEMDVRYDSQTPSADVGKGTQSGDGRNGW